MKKILDTLEATTTRPIGDIGDFIRLNHTPYKLSYLPGERSVAFGNPSKQPLAVFDTMGFVLGNTQLSLGKNSYGSDFGDQVDYDLENLLQKDFPGKISLEHLGISINVSNTDAVISEVVEECKRNTHQVVTSFTGNQESIKYLSLGTDDNCPTLEIAFPRQELNIRNHFQIAVGTPLSLDEIDNYFNKRFKGRGPHLKGDIVRSKNRKMGKTITLKTCDGFDMRLHISSNERFS